MNGWLELVLPVVTGIIGWLGSAYRNKQKREADVLSNVQVVLDIQNRKIDDQEKRIQAIENENRQYRWIIRQAHVCSIKDNSCPVLNEQYRIDKKREEREDEYSSILNLQKRN